MNFLATKTMDQAPVVRASETLADQVDAFVMAVTESLCVFEKSGSVMDQPANRERKARILAALGELDQLVGALRSTTTDLAGLDIPFTSNGEDGTHRAV